MKFIQKIINILNRVPDMKTVEATIDIHNILHNIDVKMSGIYNKISSGFPDKRINYSSKELLSVQLEFEDSIETDVREELKGYMNDLHACIHEYDIKLYESVRIVANDYVALLYHITRLKVLREYILRMLVGDSDSIIYLYLHDNVVSREVCNRLPCIDTNRIFLTKAQNSTSIDVEKFILISMIGHSVIIDSTTGLEYFDNKYKNTVLRVLYSIYRNKYYLYHLTKQR